MAFGFAGCQTQDNDGYAFIDPPVEGLAWGMTQEEAMEALGLQEDDIEPQGGFHDQWWLTTEQAGLKDDTLLGLEISGKDPIVQVFFKKYGGVVRLADVSVHLRADTSAQLKEALITAYGEPVTDEHNVHYWISCSPERNATKEDYAKLDPVDYDNFPDIAGGERKRFTVQPLIVVQSGEPTAFGKSYGPATVFELDEPAKYWIDFRGHRYLSSLYGSFVFEEAPGSRVSSNSN